MKYRFSRRVLAAVLVSLLALTACGPLAGNPPAPATETAAPPPANTPEPVVEATATEEVVEEPTAEPTATEEAGTLEDAQAATVQVVVQGSQFLEEFIGSGSGVIYDPSGLVITNNHVVEGAAIIQVKIEGEPALVSARVRGKSPCDDLAVLQLDGSDYPFAELGGEINVGDDVFAIGYPLGDPLQSTTKGIASKLGVALPAGFADYRDAIQTDAAINPGNSGGPLVTREGRVIGINSAGLDSAQGTNFAISMDYAESVIEKLAAGENIGWIGLNAAPLPADAAAEFGIALEPGLFVYAVDSGSPADQAGVQEGDFVTSIEGISVGADGTLKDYCDVLRSHDPDDVLDIQVLREGARFAGQLNNPNRPLEGGETIVIGEPEEPGSEPAEPVGDGQFVEVTDDTGRISLQLPDVWEVSTGDQVLFASSDIEAWTASFGGTSEGAATIAGFFIQANDQEGTVDIESVREFIGQTAVPENCTFDESARADYADGVYQGLYDIMPCDQGEYVTLIAFDPEAPTFLIWIEGYVISEEDSAIFQNALQTFFVTP